VPRLRRVDCSSPGIARRRRGRGFSYIDPAGAPVGDRASLERIRSLAIPPAWENVWICPLPNGHRQAVGMDAAGRRQYLYHPAWREHRDREKFAEMIAFAQTLPGMRRAIASHLRRDGLTRERVLAGAVALLDRGLFRVGGEAYAEENGSYGLATLERRHVRLAANGTLVFYYPGKTGKRQMQEVVDPALHRLATELKETRRSGAEFLAYRNLRGWVDVDSAGINAFVKELTGDGFSAKDFRTWHATVLTATAVARAGTRPSARGRERVVREAIREVAESLGNTPAVCRASYVDPRVLDLYRTGTTIEPGLRRQDEIEAAVIDLLER
jgi:DNA topoisomerase IB